MEKGFYDDGIKKPEKEKVKINSKKELLYPHQIKIAAKNNDMAIVKKSYFKGSYWLVEVEFNNQNIFLNHFLVL